MRALAILMSAAAVLAGCGGGDEESEPSGPAATPTISAGEATAMDSAAKSNARNAVSELESCFVTVQTYKQCELPAKRLPVGSGPGQVEIAASAAATFEIAAHSESGATFRIERGADYALTRTCEPAGTGGCSADGTW